MGKEIYDDDYYMKGKNSPYVGYPTSTLSPEFNQKLFKDRVTTFSRRFKKGTTFIDWGCANGYFVDLLNKAGFISIGYDFADWSIKNKVCEGIFQADALTMKEEDVPSVDIMHSADFLEHLPPESILEFLVKISKKCKQEMWHYVPFYEGIKIPTAQNSKIHLTQVENIWWKDVFEQIPNFKIIQFPDKPYGGYIVCKRSD